MDIWHLHNQVRGEQMSAIIIINFLLKKKNHYRKIDLCMILWILAPV